MTEQCSSDIVERLRVLQTHERMFCATYQDISKEAADEIERLRGLAQAAQQPRWRHKKRGTFYTEIGRGTLQAEPSADLCEGDEIIFYRGDDGRLWCRRVEEFEDGRFEAVAVASARMAKR
jgi:hypothetical protein